MNRDLRVRLPTLVPIMLTSRWSRTQTNRLYVCIALLALSAALIYFIYGRQVSEFTARNEPVVLSDRVVSFGGAVATLRRNDADKTAAVEKLEEIKAPLPEKASVEYVNDEVKDNPENHQQVAETAESTTTTSSTTTSAPEHLRISPSTVAVDVELEKSTTTLVPDTNPRQDTNILRKANEPTGAAAAAAASGSSGTSSSNFLRPFPFFDGRKWSNPDGEASVKPFPMDIEFVFNNPELCKVPEGGRPLDWLVYFHSKPDNVEKRKHLRETWANENLFNDTTTKRVFFFGLPLGRPEEKQLMTSLAEEYVQYKDIVVGNFMDTYINLTLKSVMALKWVSMYCTNAKHAIKGDEDVFVNIVEVTSRILRQPVQSKLITCPIFYENSMPILRDPKNCMKWCVDPDEFPGDSMYPRYCSGAAYAFSIDIAGDMYRAAMGTRFFFSDDVYTMGLLPLKLPYNKQLTWVDIPFEYESDKAINDYATGGVAAKLWVIMTSRMEAYDYYFTRMLRKLTNEQILRLDPAIRQQHGLN